MIVAQGKNGDIRDTDGHREYHIDGYWIRYYEPHKKEDLATALKLVDNFEWRFRKAAEGGMEVVTAPARIEALEKEFGAAQARKAAIAEHHSPEYRRAGAEENAYGGMLGVSIFRRMIEDVREHIRYRNRHDTLDGEDQKILGSFKERIDRDFQAMHRLLPFIRRAGGEKDRDQVLAEMVGEPVNVLLSTLPESKQMLGLFYERRYRKIADSWKNIDWATVAVQTLVESSPALKQTELPRLIDDLSAAAKSRCELMRSDPDFDGAAANLRINRDLIRSFSLAPAPEARTHAARLNGSADKEILALVQRYRKLVYDIAHVRTPRKESTRKLVEDMEKFRTRASGIDAA